MQQSSPTAPPTHRATSARTWPALLLALVAIALSTGVLYLTVGVYGTSEGWYDSGNYLSGALQLVEGHGFTLKAYDIATDTLRYKPITHYPPVTSLVYAFFLWLGVPFIAAPAWTALCCWPLFLVGIGVLTYRLSSSWWGAAVAVVIASLTNTYLSMFQWALSEPVFLPLLVWVVVVLVGLPLRERLPPVQTAVAIVLLALLMMTRYVGVVFFGAAGLWWVWWRVRRGWARRLVGEVPLWSLSALPFAAWMVRNRLVSEAVVGTHTQASRNTFWEGLSALLNQTSQVLVPAVGPLPTIAASETSSADVVLQFGLQLAIIGILVLPGRRLWQIYRRRGQPLALPPSPVVALPGAFVGLYVVVQPFVSFRPMDYRDSTTLMALLQPLLIAVIVRVLQRRAGPILGGYAALNLFIVVVPVLLFGVPRVITFFPPRVHDFAERSAGLYYYQHRVPGWLLVTPIRMSLVPRFHPQVAAFLADVNGPDTVVIGNIGHVLFYYEGQAHVPWRVFENRPNYQGVYDWLEVGQCQSQHNVILLVFRSGVENIYADWVVPAIAEKCPGLEPELVGDVLVYRLPRLE